MAAAPDLKLEEAPSLPGGALPGKMRMSELPVVTTAIKPPPAIVPPGAEPGIPAAEPVPSQPSGRTITFVGPQITYRVNPSIPLDVRSLVAGETQIDVAVKIDATGKVTDAQVTSSRGAAARLVAAEAIKAARLCRFQPARENDHPVQSRMVLTFRFRQ
ncbi:MAG: TonB family protein [Bryobacteraceae bacterium]